MKPNRILDADGHIIERDKADPDVRSYAERLVRGTLEKLASIDRTIEKFAEGILSVHLRLGKQRIF